MIAKLITFVSSLVAGASLLFGGGSGLSMPLADTSMPGTVQQDPGTTQNPDAPQSENGSAGHTESQPRTATGARPLRRLNNTDRHGGFRQPGPGDEMVRYGLVLAAVSATGLSPVDVLSGLDQGSSIAEIAESAGKSAEDVLAVYDATVEYFFNQAVENGRLPEELAQSRIAWYQEVGRQMVDQPGLEPPFPGLQELHRTIVLAAGQVGDLNRGQIREGLQNCQSLEEILVENRHTGQEAVDYAAERIGNLLDRGVEAGKLTDEQAGDWLASITAALEEMVKTPGLEIAGLKCSN